MTEQAFRTRALSLGAGVQSTTVALLAGDGRLPPFDCIVFADTGDEPIAVYDHGINFSLWDEAS